MNPANPLYRALAVTAILSVMLGCKADAGKTDPGMSGMTTTAEPPVPPRETRPVLVCFGDSLTAGYGVDTGQAYPDYLQDDLDQNDFHYRVVNAGVSGDTTKDGLARIERVIDQHPKIIVVEFGANDGLRGLPLSQTQANLESIVSQLKASGAQVALAGITLPPDYGADYVHRFNAMYTTLAAKYHVRLLPFLLQGAFGVPGSMQDDRSHATAQGNRQVAQNVYALIQPMLVQ